ncbi:MAG: TolC family protein [Spirochaetota bacterium]
MHRSNRLLLCGLVAACVLLPVSVSADEALTLAEILESLEDTSRRWTADELAMREARLAYERARAIIYPRLDLALPLRGSTTLENTYSSSVGGLPDVEVTQAGGYSLSATPGLTLTQALPTAGALSLSLSDRFAVSDPGEFDPEAAGDLVSEDERLDQTITVGLGLDQPLYFGGSAFAASLDTAENSWSRAGITRLQSENQLALDAAELFFRIQYLGYSRALVASRLQAAGTRLRTVEREFELGIHTRSVLLQAQLAKELAEIDLYDAERSLSDAVTTFRTLYGISASRPLGDRVESLNVELAGEERIVSAALAGHPELETLRLAARDAENSIVVYESDQAPRLSVGADLVHTDTSEEDRPNRSTIIQGSVTITANLFDGGTTRRRVDELERAARRAQINVAQSADSVRLEVETVMADMERGRRYRDYLRTAEEIAAYEYEKGRNDRGLGVITDRDLLELELELEGTRLKLANAVVEANMMKLRLLALQGASIIETITGREGADS